MDTKSSSCFKGTYKSDHLTIRPRVSRLQYSHHSPHRPSESGLGAIVCQQQGKDIRVIGFSSRNLSPAANHTTNEITTEALDTTVNAVLAQSKGEITCVFSQLQPLLQN